MKKAENNKKISYPNGGFRLSLQIRKELKSLKEEMGMTWNMFFKHLLVVCRKSMENKKYE